ncbi:MAG: septal ring lytic transglycosylase RlpA family lipoprotein [Candidatus Omnitrophica bacterium]|nr:septal ring lytic transglycosylase RlpA family lipoprotein [Candidatus Omnitrophota bacterium]
MNRHLFALFIFIMVFLSVATLAQGTVDEVHDVVAAELYGVSSWYSCDDPGIMATTANMELFNDKELTCAMWGVPFQTLVEVVNIRNNKSVIVRVNDRGPAFRFVEEGRVIDLTKEAFSHIAELDEGLIEVTVAVLQRRHSFPQADIPPK